MTTVIQSLSSFRAELMEEWKRILSYWLIYSPDNRHEGFVGRMDNDNMPDHRASKGLVLNARILYTFSAAYRFHAEPEYLQMAQRAFDYLINKFRDPFHGGFYWLLDAEGNKTDGRKQVYGHAFCLYAFSEYYAATEDPHTLELCRELFQIIEKYAFDSLHAGYLEAFSENWSALVDQRLSEKDLNCSKTTNTQLHIVEAYANLYRVWPDSLLKERIISLLQVFNRYIINPATGHLRLFFDEGWTESADVISYGHDIESAWLLPDCAGAIRDHACFHLMKEQTIPLTNAAAEGLDADGGLWYEFNLHTHTLVMEKHWWPQAEAMVGFYYAWQLTGNNAYLDYSVRSWRFVKKHIIDHIHGEWFWGVLKDYSVMQGQDKIGFWKCPYHNARACLELIKRIDATAE